ncbi:MAG: RNA polymerase sigma-70 factor [Tannerella sp.]|jgi:RNA polymerase sigma-70 factor (ECF subfamily)|nr:RNA polymerase sigma-70 factor [Tannerella sp.]
MLDDILIFNKIKLGDVKTFETVFRSYYASLCLYSSSITGRTDVAEDMVQDVFYNIWKNRESLQIKLSMKNYLYGAVRNHSIRYIEQLALQKRHIEETLHETGSGTEPSPQELLEYDELEGLINRILNKLPERCRLIFKMHRFGGKKYKEIADELSVSIKTVEADMTKAYCILQKDVEKFYHDK